MTHRNLGIFRRIRAACLIGAMAATPALCAAQAKLTLGVPGVPAIFGDTIAFVADKQGFFKKYGVDVTVRQFETGAAASRAVAAGEISAGLPPTPLVISQVSNTDVPLVGIWGMEHPDWLIGSTDPAAT
ncbi:MAG: ABC transporter substrate-binding protein, partial [Betaproteobacteria bacterium]